MEYHGQRARTCALERWTEGGCIVIGAARRLKLVDISEVSARDGFLTIAAALRAILPSASIEHVGSTSVPGCLTKGDLDILVRVESASFESARAALDAVLHPAGRNPRTDYYAEYDCSVERHSASVQLVVAGCWHDRRFSGWRDALLGDASLVTRYNDLKRRYQGRPHSEYEMAKSDLIDSVLGPADVAAGSTILPASGLLRG